MDEIRFRVYGRLVICKRRTIEQVPESYRADVQKWIDEQDAIYKKGY